MDQKVIRALVTKQLKKNHHGFRKLTRKEKKQVIKHIYQEVIDNLNEENLFMETMSHEQCLGIEEDLKDIYTLEEMKNLIEEHKSRVIHLNSKKMRSKIPDELLKLVDSLLIDSIIDHILSPESMTPSKRDWMPSTLLRVELLRTIRFSGMSCRKFCEYIGSTQRKEERAFCHLPLKTKDTPDHSTLSRFRSSLTFPMKVNLMVYMLHHFMESGRLGDANFHMLDSTDVDIPVNTKPLFSIDIEGKDMRFYADPEVDSGPRRTKRNKSSMYVGYRVHTLCVVDVETEIAFPLVSIVAAANHHDSQFTRPILKLAKAMGIEVKLLVGDEAYGDPKTQGELAHIDNISVVSAQQSRAKKVPENVDEKTGYVFCHEYCETAMKWMGYDEDEGHLFICDNDVGCPFSHVCTKRREIPLDTKLFGPIPKCVPHSDDIINMRKVCERPFNLLKHIDGVEPSRMKGRPGLSAQVTFSMMVNYFKVLSGKRSFSKNEEEEYQKEQLVLFDYDDICCGIL